MSDSVLSAMRALPLWLLGAGLGLLSFLLCTLQLRGLVSSTDPYNVERGASAPWDDCCTPWSLRNTPARSLSISGQLLQLTALPYQDHVVINQERKSQLLMLLQQESLHGKHSACLPGGQHVHATHFTWPAGAQKCWCSDGAVKVQLP